MKSALVVLSVLLVDATALASVSQRKASRPAAQARTRTRVQPCQGEAPQRSVWPQGTLLWGTQRKVVTEEMSSVLRSVDLARIQRGGTALKGVRLEGGRLVAPSLEADGLVGAVFQGTASDGQPVEVAVCGAEPAPRDPSMVWYRVELWNEKSASWENPCAATSRVPAPRALAVRGVWDETGARAEAPGKFTFACENGAIAKCIDWGYAPWATRSGRALADLHQACTRMARADYCGDGRSHTREDNPIDMYDDLAVLTRTTAASRSWSPERASFEAAWTPEGAWCLARTREGQTLEALMTQCPGRFEAGVKDLGGGDRCTVLRKGGSTEAVLLRNHSYGKGEQHLPRESTP
jgi:hypothetical protein